MGGIFEIREKKNVGGGERSGVVGGGVLSERCRVVEGAGGWWRVGVGGGRGGGGGAAGGGGGGGGSEKVRGGEWAIMKDCKLFFLERAEPSTRRRRASCWVNVPIQTGMQREVQRTIAEPPTDAANGTGHGESIATMGV